MQRAIDRAPGGFGGQSELGSDYSLDETHLQEDTFVDGSLSDSFADTDAYPSDPFSPSTNETKAGRPLARRTSRPEGLPDFRVRRLTDEEIADIYKQLEATALLEAIEEDSAPPFPDRDTFMAAARAEVSPIPNEQAREQRLRVMRSACTLAAQRFTELMRGPHARPELSSLFDACNRYVEATTHFDMQGQDVEATARYQEAGDAIESLVRIMQQFAHAREPLTQDQSPLYTDQLNTIEHLLLRGNMHAALSALYTLEETLAEWRARSDGMIDDLLPPERPTIPGFAPIPDREVPPPPPPGK